ncbi:deoxyribonuclease-1-like [Babylonia areolata]|uniref:deoxyribonuclease-1-like n=1 Tax=Babylonia areolata TaxID=304850 RepID=UPI003FCF39AA
MTMRRLFATGFVLFLLLALRAGWSEGFSLRNRLTIGAFNVRAFGENKMSDPAVVEHLKKIVERYDVLLIQEIRDKCEKSVRKLVDVLDLPFNFVISDRVGRTASKEQYAFFYRADRVLVLGKFLYNDTNDYFEREPFVVQIAPEFASRDTVSLIALHSKPTNATAEIGKLKEVIEETLDRIGHHSELFVMGDLNAGCSYSNYNKRVRANDYLTLNTDTYTWLIGEEQDTTTKISTNCPYDRIIVRSGPKSHVVPNTAQPFDYAAWLGLTEEQALNVSDHYPVEVQLRF